ncbi:hypothetical protein [Lysobacter solisilvae (ex Woo and Kim 2020)]|uniref:Uncharacterized protein n=1 Tax=Agrilutibacter terrestris TaxID=2865112 RepID=A0A7H0FWZ5_9GAMM|nr:hypothetical protein [Lysobacter terrestris]QNP40561.1 hypothetical protein H8B22_14010 [Lysobacter terrestris]
MNLHQIPSVDEVLLNAVLRVAHDECRHGEWRDIEPALAATWERMRNPQAPHWEDVADRVRSCCEENGMPLR